MDIEGVGGLLSVSCLKLWFLVLALLLIYGGAMPASLCYAGKGVGLNIPVIFLHALLSFVLTVLAWHDLPQTVAQYSIVE